MGGYLEKDVVIIGAGIAGLATALALKRVGVGALVLERSHELRAYGAALSLFPNAWLALDALGVSHKLAPIYPPFTKNGNGPRCVHRKVLLKALADELPVDSVRFSCKVTSIETKKQDDSTITLVSLEDGTTIKAKDLVADPNWIQELVINNFAKDLPSSYIDVVKHSDLSTLTLSPLVFRYPWDIILGNTHKSNVALAGDAMHPMTPDLGQGGCAALENAVVLGRHIGHSFIQHGKLVPSEVPKILGSYVAERKWRVAGLIAGSYFSGWAQQNGSGWFMKFLRDVVFYRILYKRIIDVTHFDCGKLPFPCSSH